MRAGDITRTMIRIRLTQYPLSEMIFTSWDPPRLTKVRRINAYTTWIYTSTRNLTCQFVCHDGSNGLSDIMSYQKSTLKTNHNWQQQIGRVFTKQLPCPFSFLGHLPLHYNGTSRAFRGHSVLSPKTNRLKQSTFFSMGNKTCLQLPYAKYVSLWSDQRWLISTGLICYFSIRHLSN